MKTSEAVMTARKANSKLTMTQALALAELIRVKETNIEEIIADFGTAKVLTAVADNYIADNHIDFKSQTPIHATDCLVCGAVKVGA